MARYDVIVVGGGSAGCVLAARLSEDSERSVLLVEAGPVPRSAAGYPGGLLDAGTILGADPGHPENWAFEAKLMPGRPYSIARGRVLGGSSAINGAYFQRAREADFTRWATVGGEEWSWSQALPFYRSLEADADFGSTATHGASGPIPVWRPPQTHPITAAFAAAAAELGYPLEADKNAQEPAGLGPLPLNIVDGVRWNAGLAYLEPALDRPNLSVLSESRVLRVLFDGNRVRGIEVQGGEVIETELVVLSAGSIMSPHLLAHSGVGPRAQLEALGIPVVAGLDGVGSDFSDHPQIAVGWRPTRDIVEYDLGYPMASGLNFTSPGSPIAGDLEILPLLKPTGYLLTGEPTADTTLNMLVSLMHETSRGSISTISADPLVPPRIDYRYLSTPEDRARMRYAVTTAATLLRSNGFVGLFGGFTEQLEAALVYHASLDAWIAGHLGTSIHLCGTAKLGAADDPGAVVDSRGSVYGVSGLVVADTSILPDAPTRGPAATAVLIGERIASFLRA